MPGREGAESKLSTVVTGILVGVVVAVVSLFLEYKIGFFTRSFSTESPAPHEASNATRNQDVATTPQEADAGSGESNEPSDFQEAVKQSVASGEGAPANGTLLDRKDASPAVANAELRQESGSQEKEQGRVTIETPKPQPSKVLQSEEIGDFRFDLYSCKRNGYTVTCSLTVTNISYEQRKVNLCGASHFVDSMGRRPKTKVKFDGGGCRISGLVQNLAIAFEMLAEVSVDSDEVTIVLEDGSWGEFSGSAVFRLIKIL